MKFCDLLCNDLNFEPKVAQPCCNVRSTVVPQFAFSGGYFDLAAYGKHIEETVARLQTDAALCRNCPHLVDLPLPEGASPAASLLFRTVSINMHRHLCNCKCVYCDLWQKRSGSYAILPVLKSLADQDAFRASCMFSWGGGEPGILPDFDAASLWILQSGWLQYVHTNALRFSPAIAKLLRAGRGAVNISLDSASQEVYRDVKGVDGFAKVVSSLEQYRAAADDGRRIHLKYIIFEKNNKVKEIERFFALCRSLDITIVQYSLNFLEVNSGSLSQQTLLGAAFFVHRALSLGMKCEPFFIDDHLLDKIFALEKQYFSGSE